MKNNLAISLCIICIFIACTQQNKYNKLLNKADSLMAIRPDSSLQILESISINELNTDENKARYALLLTQAKDKNYITETDDSLIKIAIRYYDTEHNTRMQSQAYYNWGSIYRNKNEQATAVEKYLIAASYVQKTTNKPLAGRIYNNLGYLYYLQDLYDKADSIYRITEDIGIQLKDTGLWAESLSQQGEIKFRKKQYPQAEQKQIEALHILGEFKNNNLRANIAAALSSIYNRTEDLKKAVYYAKENISFQRDTSSCYRAFLLLGDAFFKTQQHDSAIIFINKSLPSSSYATKAGAYLRLADISRIRGEINLSLEMERLYSLYLDSLNQSTQSSDIIEVEKQIVLQNQKKLYENFLLQHRYYILILLGCSILLLYILRKRYLKRIILQKQINLQVKDQLDQQYSLFKTELEQKEKEITVLKKEIDQHNIDEEHRLALEKEYEILKKQRAELIKQSLKHSDVYEKIQRILLDYKEKDFSKESLDEKDWLKLISEIDKNDIIYNLSIRYHFTEKETQLCYLLLLDLSYTDRANLMKITRRTHYRKEEEILKKMGEIYSAGKLQSLLKGIMNM